MNEYWLRKTIVAAPIVACVAVGAYLFERGEPASDARQVHERAEAIPVTATPSALHESMVDAPEDDPAPWDSFAQSATDNAIPVLAPAGGLTNDADLETPVLPVPDAGQLEQTFTSLDADISVRADAMMQLAKVDSARAAQLLDEWLAAESTDDRQLAVSLLREWSLRSGGRDAYVGHLLQRAALDSDPSVARAARAALDPERVWTDQELGIEALDVEEMATFADQTVGGFAE